MHILPKSCSGVYKERDNEASAFTEITTQRGFWEVRSPGLMTGSYIAGKHSPGVSGLPFVLGRAVTLMHIYLPKVCSCTSYWRRKSSMAVVSRVKLLVFTMHYSHRWIWSCKAHSLQGLITDCLLDIQFSLICILPPRDQGLHHGSSCSFNSLWPWTVT